MANFRDGYLDQSQPLGQNIGTVNLTADSLNVNPTGLGVVRLYSDSTVASDRDFTIDDSTLIGQELTLVLYSGGGTTCRLIDVGNVILAGTWTPSQYDSLQLYWDGSDWVETSRTASGSEFNPVINGPLGGNTLVYNQTDDNWENQIVSGAITMNEEGVTTLSSLDLPLTDSNIFIGDGSNLISQVPVTGDITISNSGVTSISSGVIVDSDINDTAGIQLSKLAPVTSSQILLGSPGNIPTPTAVTGVISIDNTGLTSFNGSISIPFIYRGNFLQNQILNLNTTPVTILPNPPTGYAYIVDYITFFLIGGTPYSGGSNMEISCNGVTLMTLGANLFVDNTSPYVFIAGFNTYDVSASNVDPDVYGINMYTLLNSPVQMQAVGAAFTGGDLAAPFYVSYRLQQIT